MKVDGNAVCLVFTSMLTVGLALVLPAGQSVRIPVEMPASSRDNITNVLTYSDIFNGFGDPVDRPALLHAYTMAAREESKENVAGREESDPVDEERTEFSAAYPGDADKWIVTEQQNDSANRLNTETHTADERSPTLPNYNGIGKRSPDEFYPEELNRFRLKPPGFRF